MEERFFGTGEEARLARELNSTDGFGDRGSCLEKFILQVFPSNLGRWMKYLYQGFTGDRNGRKFTMY